MKRKIFLKTIELNIELNIGLKGVAIFLFIFLDVLNSYQNFGKVIFALCNDRHFIIADSVLFLDINSRQTCYPYQCVTDVFKNILAIDYNNFYLNKRFTTRVHPCTPFERII